MLTDDPRDLVSYRQQDLLAEAESERLLALLPQRAGLSVRDLYCHLASWLTRQPRAQFRFEGVRARLSQSRIRVGGACSPPPPVAAPFAGSLRAPSRGDPPRTC